MINMETLEANGKPYFDDISDSPPETDSFDKIEKSIVSMQQSIRRYEKADEDELKDILRNIEYELGELIGYSHTGIISDLSEEINNIVHWGHDWKRNAKSGLREWKLNSVHHRTDGPAIIYDDASVEYWLNGVQYKTFEAYNKELERRKLLVDKSKETGINLTF